MAGLYEETRVFDTTCLNSALTYFSDRFPPDKFGNMFYPGIGTGRIAIPLAEKGYKITGIDISEEMLSLLDDRLRKSERFLPVSARKADVLDLPFADGEFDIAITVHFFYFIPQWKKAIGEILRVVKDNGILVLMHTGTGTEIPFINERYKELSASKGYVIPETGAASNREVAEYCESLGYQAEWVRDRWRWTSNIRLDKALEYVKSRAYSFTTFAPDDIHISVVESLADEMRSRFDSLSAEVSVPNQIYFAFISR
jgi:ubiquinone/menaquinone biosynthesis C-methylase UbiE